jgi:hypothetical protein
MLSYILKLLIREIIEAVVKAASDYLILQKIKKEKKEIVKEVLSEKDPQVRAKRITDLLSTSS